MFIETRQLQAGQQPFDKPALSGCIKHATHMQI
jgi:hypothetical protein